VPASNSHHRHRPAAGWPRKTRPPEHRQYQARLLVDGLVHYNRSSISGCRHRHETWDGSNISRRRRRESKSRRATLACEFCITDANAGEADAAEVNRSARCWPTASPAAVGATSDEFGRTPISAFRARRQDCLLRFSGCVARRSGPRGPGPQRHDVSCRGGPMSSHEVCSGLSNNSAGRAALHPRGRHASPRRIGESQRLGLIMGDIDHGQSTRGATALSF